MELNLSQFITRLFAAAQAAGIAPAEAACSQSDSFNTRVRRGELESYQVSERISLTLRGQVGGRIGTANTQALTEESIPMLVQGVLDHLVGDGVGEHDQQVGVAQPVFQRPSHLGDDFGRTLVRTAEIFILADHALVSA